MSAESDSMSIGRMLKTAGRLGAFRDAFRTRWTGLPQAVPLMVREGVGIRTIHQVNACLHPERKAVVDKTRELTCSELNDEINRIANAMREQFAVRPGTPVMVAMKNRVEYFSLWMALARIGAATVHASWRQTSEELAYQLEHSGAKLLFAGQSVNQALQGLGEDFRSGLEVVGVDEGIGERSWEEFLAGTSSKFPSIRGEEEDGRSDNVVYTSGTTGRPKGAVRDMANQGVADLFQILERLPIRMADRHLVVSPIYHSAGQVFSIMNTSLGSTLYFLPDFDPEQTLRALHEWAIDSIFLVPTMLRRILELDEEIKEKYPTPALRAIICGAAPFPHSLRQRAIDHFGPTVIHDFYGATEIGWITLINGEEMLEKPGSVGRPIAGQRIRIVDEDNNRLGPNEPGVIYVHNEHIMEGYLGDRGATEEIMDGQWMTVDDLGYLDEEGYLFLAGRARDMVISGGVNIYPAEIENVLQGHDAIVDVAVFGVDDEEWGEALVAVVAAGREVEEEELEAYAGEHLSSYKVPRRWYFIDEIPRNPTGKILKRTLEERYAP